jgi:hypothetical protein
MAFAQYTKCVAPTGYSGPFLGSAAFWAALAASIIAGVFDPGAGVLGLLLTGIAYCRWWLYGRLVCLGGNHCVIGLALGVYNQTNQSGIGKFDTDYGVQVLLAPSLLSDSINEVGTTNSVQGFLVQDQRAASPPNPFQAAMISMYSNYSNLGFTGEPESFEDLTGTVGVGSGQGVLSAAQATAIGLQPTPPAWQANNFYVPGALVVDGNGCLETCTTYSEGLSGGTAPPWSETVGGLTMDNAIQWSCGGAPGAGTMEVEFEGAGVWDLYQSLLAAVPLAATAAVVCAIPVIGWVVCAILILIVLAIVAVGAVIGLNDTATPAGDDPSIGVIHPGVDILFVLGTWILDSAHTGWNELHPVLACQKIGTVPNKDLISGNPWASQPEFRNPARLKFRIDSLCGLTTEANDPATVNNQQQPQNQWTLHPTVDGCTPAPAPPNIR